MENEGQGPREDYNQLAAISNMLVEVRESLVDRIRRDDNDELVARLIVISNSLREARNYLQERTYIVEAEEAIQISISAMLNALRRESSEVSIGPADPTAVAQLVRIIISEADIRNNA